MLEDRRMLAFTLGSSSISAEAVTLGEAYHSLGPIYSTDEHDGEDSGTVGIVHADCLPSVPNTGLSKGTAVCDAVALVLPASEAPQLSAAGIAMTFADQFFVDPDVGSGRGDAGGTSAASGEYTFDAPPTGNYRFYGAISLIDVLNGYAFGGESSLSFPMGGGDRSRASISLGTETILTVSATASFDNSVTPGEEHTIRPSTCLPSIGWVKPLVHLPLRTE